MRGCTISDEWSYRGIKTVILENELIRASILIDYGAKIHEFIYKSSNRDFMYHNPRTECRPPVFGVNVDNWWTGGMDEAIPTGHPCTFKGEEYPFLGEAWPLSWYYEILERDDEKVCIHLWRPLIISPLLVERWVSLKRSESMLHLQHKITNIGNSNFEFIWGLHPGFSINPDCRIDLPAEEMFIDESLPNDRLGKRGTIYKWPYAADREGKQVDMRQVLPKTAGTCDFHYATVLQDGWLAMTDVKKREGVGLVFPKEIFGTAWLWLVYGGWRGLYTAAVEAWTGYPAKLSEAFEIGKYSQLMPGEKIECETKLIAYTGIEKVIRIDTDGRVYDK